MDPSDGEASPNATKYKSVESPTANLGLTYLLSLTQALFEVATENMVEAEQQAGRLIDELEEAGVEWVGAARGVAKCQDLPTSDINHVHSIGNYNICDANHSRSQSRAPESSRIQLFVHGVWAARRLETI
ncbi:hypothetical protein GGX14DRAFT_396179 [Mycena pura]|uniref:Uncharacterized protein n=1 Tax=Mycena pura TaxID=153505 RepID=A0AAD6VC59_9AGAR|nr:hypothetical protein GGX14DRAFT_396179 [Mycena pura]